MTERRKLRFGIAGMTSDHVWGMGDGLAALPEVELVAGAEPHAELRERAARQWNLERTYEDPLAMLEREEVDGPLPLDAILVCCDNAGKAEIAEAAAARGIHVYQDKPMAATLAQADRILRAVESSGITLMVAYHSAFNPLYEPVKQLIAAGAIGRFYLARGVTGHAGPAEIDCSRYFCEWLFDRERNGGGTFVDEACYLLDAFLDTLGPVVEVSAFTAQMGHRDYLPPDVEDNAVAILRFANGGLGVIDSKWGQIGPAPVRTSYHGVQGTIVSGPAGTELYSTAETPAPEGWEPLDMSTRAGRYRTPGNLRGWRAPTSATAPQGHGGLEQRTFVRAVLDRRPIEGATSPRVARDVQEVIEAVYRSAERGAAVRLPLE
jgi:predicted dehydrogenase